MALLVVLRGSFLGVIGTLLFNDFWYFWRWNFHSCYIDSSSNPKEFYFYHFFIYYYLFWKNRGLTFMKWLINKAFLTPSVEQLLRLQADSWTSKTIQRASEWGCCLLQALWPALLEWGPRFSDDQLTGKRETIAFVGRLAPSVIPATGTQPVDQGWGNGQVGYWRNP